jgi:hypothetical protein
LAFFSFLNKKHLRSDFSVFLHFLDFSWICGRVVSCCACSFSFLLHRAASHHFLFAGKAEGVLFEDVGDGYEFTRGEYLLTNYVAELHSSVVTVRVSKTEGLWKRPKRRLHVQLLLGGGAMVCHNFLRDC